MLLTLNEEKVFDGEDRLMNDENHHKMIRLEEYHTLLF
jgi:hypothetical protein